jgi:hypothetical protein
MGDFHGLGSKRSPRATSVGEPTLGTRSDPPCRSVKNQRNTGAYRGGGLSRSQVTNGFICRRLG